MPAFVKSNVGSLAGNNGDERTRVCPRCSKYLRKSSRISLPVMIDLSLARRRTARETGVFSKNIPTDTRNFVDNGCRYLLVSRTYLALHRALADSTLSQGVVAMNPRSPIRSTVHLLALIALLACLTVRVLAQTTTFTPNVDNPTGH